MCEATKLNGISDESRGCGNVLVGAVSKLSQRTRFGDKSSTMLGTASRGLRPPTSGPGHRIRRSPNSRLGSVCVNRLCGRTTPRASGTIVWCHRTHTICFQIHLTDWGAHTRPSYSFVCLYIYIHEQVACGVYEHKMVGDANGGLMKVIRRLGLLAHVMVDRGSEFQGQIAQMVKILAGLNIEISRNSARRVDSAIFTLRRAIDDRMNALRLPWRHKVGEPVVEQYNGAPHDLSRYSPESVGNKWNSGWTSCR